MPVLCTFAAADGPRLGLRVAGGWIDLTAGLRLYGVLTKPDMGSLPATMADLLAAQATSGLVTRVADFVAKHDLAAHLCLPEAPQLLAPVPRPGKVIAMARTYRSLAKESPFGGVDEPIAFLKASSTVIGPGAAVVYPRDVTRVDPEGELAVVIGRRCRRVDAATGLAAVGGYTICNDVTARDLQIDDVGQKKPYFRSKSMDTFCPLGPWMVTPEEIPDPHRLQLQLLVNGEVRQDVTTADLAFSIGAIIAALSRWITLEPGDVIATGTAGGLAPVRPGDRMEVRIAGIGALVNPVVAEDEA